MISRRILLLSLFCIYSVRAQDPPPGAATFLSNCAFCHGVTGGGGRGPSLVSARAQGLSDTALQSIVKNGIAGTGMPAFDFEPDELSSLIHYIRQFGGAVVRNSAPEGNAVHGREVYAGNGCAHCHRIEATGSIFGPELTRIGSARSIEYLRDSITNPSADIAQDYEGVEVVTRAGKHLTGVRINEDTFSVQLRLADQQFALFDKSELQSVAGKDKSLMPSYQSLSKSDLNDLVAYLASLQTDASGAAAAREPGIH